MTTTLEYFEPLGGAALGVDEPVTSRMGWAIRNNIQHALDMRPQVRVNWSASTDASDAPSVIAGAVRLLGYSFPLTQLQDGTYCDLDIRICGKTDSVSNPTIACAVVPGTVRADRYATNPSDVIWFHATTFSGATSSVIIDIGTPSANQIVDTSNIAKGKATANVNDVDGYKQVAFTMVTAIVIFGGGDDVSTITSVQIREYVP